MKVSLEVCTNMSVMVKNIRGSILVIPFYIGTRQRFICIYTRIILYLMRRIKKVIGAPVALFALALQIAMIL